MPASGASPLREALASHQTAASITDVDHVKSLGRVAIESDYIIQVESTTAVKAFEPFVLSKTYSAFRTLAHDLQLCVDNYQSVPKEMVSVARYCELIATLVDSQKVSYVGKVNYLFLLQSTTKERRRILEEVLKVMLEQFPDKHNVNHSHGLAQKVAQLVETFLLTDHVESSSSASTLATENSSNNKGPAVIRQSVSTDSTDSKSRGSISPMRKLKAGGGWFKKAATTVASVPVNTTKRIVKPITSKVRPGKANRNRIVVTPAEHGNDNNRKAVTESTTPVSQRSFYNTTKPKSGTTIACNNPKPLLASLSPILVFVSGAVALVALHFGSHATVTLDVDIAFLIVFASFCLGWNLPTGSRTSVTRGRPRDGAKYDPGARRLLWRSIMGPNSSNNVSPCSPCSFDCEEDTEESPCVLESPLPEFPAGAPIGSHNNCWSKPDNETFKVRGPRYLIDRKKIPSEDFLFPVRGIDLFLTDACPQNVGRNSGIMGGKLREKPTFVINFRLPWGVLLFYFEIPEMYLPFLEAGHGKGDVKNLPSMDDMTPAQRAACRFLKGDQTHKNDTLKIVPVVVDGPWVVKSVVGGKPAIIGTKLPTNYVYAPASGDECCYLEADLDIAASSAARSILSVTRSYTQVLTMDLGFVVQGNEEDELPEQMLVGCRLHGVDPLNAAAYPLTQEDAVERLQISTASSSGD